MTTPALYPDDHDLTTADLLVTDAVVTLPCGCTARHYCDEALMLEAEGQYRRLIEHRAFVFACYRAALTVLERQERQTLMDEAGVRG